MSGGSDRLASISERTYTEDSTHGAESTRRCIDKAEFFTVKPHELQLLCRLGSGACASVYKAEWTRTFASSTSSIYVAVKELHADLDAVYRDRERLTMLTESHPNLVECFDSTLEPPYLIITEFCAGGSLFDVLYNSKQVLTLRQKLKILADVAAGMKCLHAQRPSILHRDLKSGNILLTNPITSRSQEPFAKVADFGLSRASEVTGSASAMRHLTLGVGTWRWMAPEVFVAEEGDQYDEKADVFSFGIVMYEVLEEKLPYSETFSQDVSDPRISLHVCMGMRPEVRTSGHETDEESLAARTVLLDYMQKAWANEPSDRPTFEELDTVLQETYNKLPRPPPD
eukprot:gb/GFBE01064934.1/.p1 GENE.gb/GFBE01064934.1/~~gb/GFBE01064934.1/.p1  ORF type:complete len:342 (+),score=40.16 gb/GFBE01064934.1/:1-1026(+)